MALRRALVATVIVVAGFVGGLVISGRLSQTQSATATQTAPASQVQGRATTLATSATLPDLSSVAEQALKVSANISSTTVIEPPNDPISRWFYGNQAQRSQSLGSGVVVSPDGYVLTNRHVIGNAGAEIRVTLPDGAERPGKLVGIDEISDLAVVKVEAQNLQTLPWGDSEQLRVAEWVLAIGNPFQLSGTVTLGIVSTVRRRAEQVGAYQDFIQTDAAINPGNSGGALINARGELVGINTMIYTETGGYQGIGFAIPSNKARAIMRELIEHGSVTWGSLGDVRWATVNGEAARRFDLGSNTGVLVWQISRSAPAYRAGLQPGDVVLAFNGTPVTDAEQLDRLIVGSKVGTTAKLELVRSNGRRLTLDIPVVSRQQAAGSMRR
jgi:serine protease Do